MNSPTHATFPPTRGAPPRHGFFLLAKLRLRMLRNFVNQSLAERPLNLIGTAITLGIIWIGLYFVFLYTFYEVNKQTLEGIVAMPLIFTFFFLALTAMLAFSNAIISYGSLFRRPESNYLLSSPIAPRDMVAVKFIETLALSSWSLLLLGLPLMMAMAHRFDEPWTFYPLFIGLFILFIPMPGAFGMILAWFVAMLFPKTPKRTFVIFAVLLGIFAAWWAWRLTHNAETSNEWLKQFYDRVAIVQGAFLPHTWVAKGITHALQGRTTDAAFYLVVTTANSLLACLIAIHLVAARFTPAFARAQSTGHRHNITSGKVIGLLANILFAYLPRKQRLLAANDLRTFFRDPLQWMQMVILFGLLLLYVVNVRRLWTDLLTPQYQVLIAFLNLVAVTLILATFTSRFVFPLISLECQQLWMLGLLPLPRKRIVTAKFLYALTVTLIAALGVIALSILRLELPRPLAMAHIVSVISVCIGLCGVSIGLGARMPVFNERNPARIAGGYGGTISLMCSIVLVIISLVGMGLLSLRAVQYGAGTQLSTPMLIWLIAVALLNIIAAAAALKIGSRHFQRLQC